LGIAAPPMMGFASLNPSYEAVNLSKR
jgi:hypothetical protein